MSQTPTINYMDPRYLLGVLSDKPVVQSNLPDRDRESERQAALDYVRQVLPPEEFANYEAALVKAESTAAEIAEDGEFYRFFHQVVKNVQNKKVVNRFW